MNGHCASMLPPFSLSCARGPRHSAVPSVLEGRAALHLPSGRHAIYHALSALGVGRGDRVLVPAYHCLSMIEPLRWLGAQPDCYRMTPDLRADEAHLHSLRSVGARAMIAVHYFGFAQDMGPYRRFCDAAGMALIEDCAHAFFGGSDAGRVGAFGDYSIASPRKFLPMFDGGCLIEGRRALPDMQPRTLGLRYELKAALDTSEVAVRHGRLAGMGPVLRLFGRGARPTAPAASSSATPAESEYSDPRFAAGTVRGRMSRLARTVLAVASRERIVHRRRAHFARIETALRTVDSVRLLYQMSTEQTVPYVVPLLLGSRSDETHAALKAARVPMWRWEVLEPSACDVSARYSRSLIQLPCHQELTGAELDDLLGRLTRVLKVAPP